MHFDALLRAHGFMRVERPPEIWQADTEDVRFVPLLGEMIAAALAGGAALPELTLAVSNVVVAADDEDDDGGAAPLPGEYVAVTVKGTTDLGPDDTWRADRQGSSGQLARLHERLVVAGARYAYVRRLPPAGSITAFLSRADRPARV